MIKGGRKFHKCDFLCLVYRGTKLSLTHLVIHEAISSTSMFTEQCFIAAKLKSVQCGQPCKVMGGEELAEGLWKKHLAMITQVPSAGRSRHQVEHSRELFLRHYAITVHDQMVRGKAYAVFQGTLS